MSGVKRIIMHSHVRSKENNYAFSCQGFKGWVKVIFQSITNVFEQESLKGITTHHCTEFRLHTHKKNPTKYSNMSSKRYKYGLTLSAWGRQKFRASSKTEWPAKNNTVLAERKPGWHRPDACKKETDGISSLRKLPEWCKAVTHTLSES